MATRVGRSEAQSAKQFLQHLNELDLMMMAMIADAADESQQFCLFLDKDFDMALLGRQITEYEDRVNSLFLNGLCLRSGYTKHMIELLSRPRTILIGKETETIGQAGGPSKRVLWEVLQECKIGPD